jgi:hypothetical protein
MKQWQIWPAVLIVAVGTFAKGSAQDVRAVPVPQADSVVVTPQPGGVVVNPQMDATALNPPLATYRGTDFPPYMTGPYGVPYIPIPPEAPPARAGHWWQKPCGCFAAFNNVGCGNCRTHAIFIWGSCRQFFGQPCIKQVPAVPLPPGYGADALNGPQRCACP